MAVDQNFLKDLQKRGLVYQHTDLAALEEHLKEPRTLYCGFDPTASSFHVGSLMPLLTLRRFQLAGHKPLVLLGGATGLIGDPSFKDKERQLNTEKVASEWGEALKKQFGRFVDFSKTELVNNLDWIGKMDVITFLRDVGKHFSVNAMIAKEAVKTRLERQDVGISFTEFSYTLLQGYDFAHLYKTHGCTIQLGGSDQWGNIVSGVEYSRKSQEGAHTHALTFPLVTKADGTKFGKTEGGAIWLDAEKTSVFSFYQFWLNTPDAMVETYLKYFSFSTLTEITALMEEHNNAPHKRLGQKALAQELTALVHGTQGLEQAEHITSVVFSNAEDKWQKLSAADFSQLSQDGLGTTNFSEEKPILAVLSETGLASSNRQAREFVDAGSVKVNGCAIDAKAYNHMVCMDEAFFKNYTVVQVGKKKTHLIKWSA